MMPPPTLMHASEPVVSGTPFCVTEEGVAVGAGIGVSRHGGFELEGPSALPALMATGTVRIGLLRFAVFNMLEVTVTWAPFPRRARANKTYRRSGRPGKQSLMTTGSPVGPVPMFLTRMS